MPSLPRRFPPRSHYSRERSLPFPQLLGELARGHWGMCASAIEDAFREVTAAAAGEGRGASGLWSAIVESSRLAYAPPNDMTEEHSEEGEEEEEEEEDGEEEELQV